MPAFCLISELLWCHARLFLEQFGKIEDGLKIEFIGDLFDHFCRVAEHFFRPVYFKLDLELAGRQAGIFLEDLSEAGIAYLQLLRDLSRGNITIDVRPEQESCLVDDRVDLLSSELILPGKGVNMTEDM